MRTAVLLVGIFATRAATSWADRVPDARVVIVSVDGMRPDAIDDERTPRHATLTAQGMAARDARTIRKSQTLPSHASMISGVDVDAHGLAWNSFSPMRGHIAVPTIFSAARDRNLSTAMIVGKLKLSHLAAPGTVDHFEIPADPTCEGVAAAAAAHFTKHAPRLMLVHFSDTDDAGHAHGWDSDAYRAAVAVVDRCLGTLVDALDASPAAASTWLIVTADHGGEGKRHDHGSAAARRIPWIVRGPGITAKTALRGTVSIFDTAATALDVLGLPPLPSMKGVSRRAAGVR